MALARYNSTANGWRNWVADGYPDSPMGVATYKTAADMPEDVRRVLPDVEELKRVLNQETQKEENRK